MSQLSNVPAAEGKPLPLPGQASKRARAVSEQSLCVQPRTPTDVIKR